MTGGFQPNKNGGEFGEAVDLKKSIPRKWANVDPEKRDVFFFQKERIELLDSFIDRGDLLSSKKVPWFSNM